MANNGDSLDVNSMYSILKNIFNRELNENYSNRNRSTFAGGLADLRNGWAAMQNARKNKQDQAEYKNSMGNGGGNQYPNGSIGATGEGIYGVNSMPPQSNGGGIGVDANGVYGVNGETPQPNQSVFGGGNGFDWSKMGQMPNGGSVMDAWGKQGGNSMFSGNSEKPDNTMNITSQTIGNNYNGRIDGQVGGLGIPQSPQGGSGFNSVFNGANANPQIPSISSSNLAQGIGGQNVSANDLSKYLGNEYNRAAWIQQDMANNGVTNPLISMLRYDTKVAPYINAAKEEELRNAFFTLRNPDASEQDKMNAMALIEYRKGDPFLEENQQMRRDANTMRMQDLQSRITDRNQRSLGDYAGMNLEGQSWVRNGDSVDLSNAQPHTIAGLNHISDIFQQMTGKPLIVTSGNDGDMHAGGQFSHGKGWKIDVSGNGLEDPEIRHAFIQQCQNLGIEVLDEYEHPSANSTGGHLDLQFSGYRGNVKGRPRSNRNPYTNRTNPKVKVLSDEDKEQAIYDYADSEAPTFKQGHAIGKAWAQDLVDYAKEFDGDVGQAARQMYYDYAAMNPEERGWSMSSEKLALGVGYAVAHAKGLDGQKASNEAKKVMNYLLNNKTQQTSSDTTTQTPSKTKLKPKPYDSNKDYNYFPEDELNDSDFGGAIKKASDYQLINLKNPSKQEFENIISREDKKREKLDEGY